MTTDPMALPVPLQIELWERAVEETYADYLIEALTDRAFCNERWRLLLGHLDERPIAEGEYLGVVLDSVAAWINAHLALVGEVLPGYIDLIFPVFISLRDVLTLENAVPILTGFPAYVASLAPRMRTYQDAYGPYVTGGYEYEMRKRYVRI